MKTVVTVQMKVQLLLLIRKMRWCKVKATLTITVALFGAGGGMDNYYGPQNSSVNAQHIVSVLLFFSVETQSKKKKIKLFCNTP